MTRGDPADPIILHQSPLRSAEFTSSFVEEAAAMQRALEWATTNHPEYSLTICTDSQSLLKGIERERENPPYTSTVRGFTGGGSISVLRMRDLADA